MRTQSLFIYINVPVIRRIYRVGGEYVFTWLLTTVFTKGGDTKDRGTFRRFKTVDLSV